MQARIILEYTGRSAGEMPLMRWERAATEGNSGASKEGTFELLGRAFEVAQREEGASFEKALQAFFRGALIEREDVEAVLKKMSTQAS